MDIENEDYIKTNRENRLTPKGSCKHWCYNCDRTLVGNWEKCPVCRNRDGVKTLKKDT